METSFGFSDRECRVVLLFSKARLHEEDTKDVPLKKLLRFERMPIGFSLRDSKTSLVIVEAGRFLSCNQETWVAPGVKKAFLGTIRKHPEV